MRMMMATVALDEDDTISSISDNEFAVNMSMSMVGNLNGTSPGIFMNQQGSRGSYFQFFGIGIGINLCILFIQCTWFFLFVKNTLCTAKT